MEGGHSLENGLLQLNFLGRTGLSGVLVSMDTKIRMFGIITRFLINIFFTSCRSLPATAPTRVRPAQDPDRPCP